MISTRIDRLRAGLLQANDKAVFLERRRLLRSAAARFQDEPPEIRHARVFESILAGMSVVIGPDDLIVGRPYEEEPTPDEAAHLYDPDLRPAFFRTNGHLTVSWQLLLREGMLGIRAKAKAGLRRLGAAADPDSERKRRFWQATVICCDAVAGLAGRYADKADRLATLDDEPRRSELREIAETCRRVPAYPARTFREAIQSVWFLDFLLHTVCGARDYTLGRLDQYLRPYYEADLAAGRITRESALELIACLFVKCNEIIGYGDQQNATKRELHQDSVQYAVIGGQTSDWRDATNEISFLCLKAADALRLKQPTLTVRYHPAIDRRLWSSVIEAIRTGENGIGIYNDGTTIPALINAGVAPEDAWDIGYVGCCHPSVPGHECQLREHQHNLAKCLEYALNDGVDMLTGQQLGARTGDAAGFNTFDDVLAALKREIDFGVESLAAELDAEWIARLAETPFHFESLLVEGCVERALDLNVGARYVHHIQHAGAIATMADSLAAIRGAVYEDRLLSLVELRDILRADFAGQELLRRRLQSRYPKFGNDDDSVDVLATQVSTWFCEAILRHRSGPSGAWWPQLYTYHRYKRMGKETGATADGRHAGVPVSENQSPTLGMDRLGPTALLKSLSKLPSRLTPAGGVTVTLHPSAFSGEDGAGKLGSLLETFFATGGMHAQITVMDRETLLAAQRDPASYRHLVVRVTGYSAYFVSLDAASQAQVLAKTV